MFSFLIIFSLSPKMPLNSDVFVIKVTLTIHFLASWLNGLLTLAICQVFFKTVSWENLFPFSFIYLFYFLKTEKHSYSNSSLPGILAKITCGDTFFSWSFICWFTPQMTLKPSLGQVEDRDLELSSLPCRGWQWDRHLRHHPLPPRRHASGVREHKAKLGFKRWDSDMGCHLL